MPSVPPPSPLAPGVQLDRYELLCPIATGGMASVWVARLRGKRGFEKLVAVKTVRADFAGEPRVQKMFLDEANLAAAVRHPNVVEILDLGELHGTLFLVMEWIDGDSLSALRKELAAREERIPLRIALRVVADACAGIHAAHELHGPDGKPLGLVHRDLSPQNVLVSMSGGTKVIDFGIAKALGRVSDETGAGIVKGKVQYMAPEQACGGFLDRRSDIWSLGVVLYQLLSGRYPYEGENQLATLYALTSGKPPPPLPGTPPEVAAVVDRALAHDPASRFGTAAEMQRAIERALSKLCGPITSDDVAAFVRQHLGDRVALRRKTIERAIDAANERARVEAEFAAAADAGTDSVVRVMPSVPAPSQPPEPTAVTTLAEPVAAGLPELREATLGATSSEFARVRPSRRRRLRTVVLGIVGVPAIVLGAAFVTQEVTKAGRARGMPPRPAAAARSAPSTPGPASADLARAGAATTDADAATAQVPETGTPAADRPDAAGATVAQPGARTRGAEPGGATRGRRGTDPTDVFGERR